MTIATSRDIGVDCADPFSLAGFWSQNALTRHFSPRGQ
jgi:hypothetical protein